MAELEQLQKELKELQDSDEGSIGRLQRIRDLIASLIDLYREGIYDLAKQNGLNYEHPDHQEEETRESNLLPR